MSSNQLLSLLDRFGLTHSTLVYSDRLMRLFRSIILALLNTVDRLRHQLTMGNSVATQLIDHDPPWLTTMRPEQPPEEPLGCRTIEFGLEKHINH